MTTEDIATVEGVSENPLHPLGSKPPLDREELRDVIDLSLWMGQLLLQYGAHTDRIERTVHRLGTALGADWLDILISPNAIVATTISGEEFRTKIRRVVSIGVNMAILAETETLIERVESGEVDRFEVRAELKRISLIRRVYNRWYVIAWVGVACAGLCRLLGGDLAAVAATFIASSVAMWVRQELQHQYFNPLINVTATAFVAGVISSLLIRLQITTTPLQLLSASVLMLVPGVPLINSMQDTIRGHLVTGFARGFTGMLIAMSIALGLLLAMLLVGVEGL